MLVASFSTMQVLLSLRCGFPILRQLEPYRHCFDIEGCRSVFRTATILNICVTAAVIVIAAMWATGYLRTGLYISMAFYILLGFRKSGINEANIGDIINLIGKRVYPGKDTELFEAFVRVVGPYL